MRQRWVARWSEAGIIYEYRFTSLRQKFIARVDLGLKLIDAGCRVPDSVMLEEIGEPTDERYRTAPTFTYTLG